MFPSLMQRKPHQTAIAELQLGQIRRWIREVLCTHRLSLLHQPLRRAQLAR
jgi:hypothetical protein